MNFNSCSNIAIRNKYLINGTDYFALNSQDFHCRTEDVLTHGLE